MLGVGRYVPEGVLSKEELAKQVDTSDAWITQRTGIRERRIAADGEATSDLAIKAARAALAAPHVEAPSIDLIVLATAPPHNPFPPPAAPVQAAPSLPP